MRVIQQRLLRGANLYSPKRCIAAVVDVDDAGPEGAAAATRLAQTLLRLQQDCGQDVRFAHAEMEGADPRRYRIVVEYGLEHLAQAALQAAAELVTAGFSVDLARPAAIASAAAYEVAAGAAIGPGASAACGVPAGASLVADPDTTVNARAAAPVEAAVVQALAILRQLAASFALPAEAQALMQEAQALGVPVQRVSEHAGLLRFGWGRQQWRYLQAAAPDTALLTHTVLADRHLMRLLLDQAHVPQVSGGVAHNPQDALRIARRLGWPVLVRSTDSKDERAWPCAGEADLGAALALTGAAEIVQPPAGERFSVQVRSGQAQHSSAAVRDICQRAARALGLEQAEIELEDAGRSGPLLAAIRGSTSERVLDARSRLQQWRIATAGTGQPDGHTRAGHAGQARQPDNYVREAGRIPVIAVTGTNGKTTTTLMIAHAARLAGLATGCASTQGVSVDGQVYMQGDCTGYWSHRAVLDAPQTEIAVLETARGGLLKRGLAFDRCDVGVLLNVSDDHLGLDGVDSVETLARVKSLVLAGARTAVLNAQDPHCVAARSRLPADTRVIFFAMTPDHPVLSAHLAQGGDAAWLENEVIILKRKGVRQQVIAARDIPSAMGGLARYNIANSLAATAALAAVGFDVPRISAGLASFVSDASSNPLRTNVFRVGQLCILLDYAHNPAAYVALGELAGGLAQQAGGKVRAVVSSPGDRRDAELLRSGAACATSFDQVYVYESASRGRRHGEAAELIGEGARAAGALDVATFPAADLALQSAYRACAPGDVLVFSCGTEVETLVNAIRAVDPAAAAEIGRQL